MRALLRRTAFWAAPLGGTYKARIVTTNRLINPYSRWLFYIEGALTVFFAIISIFILPDFPQTSKWLSPLERRLAEKRLEEDVGVGDQDAACAVSQTEGFIMAFMDWKVWWLAIALTSMVISLSFNAFFPTLSKTMGFNSTVTLLLCAPPWVFATICAFLVTRYVCT